MVGVLIIYAANFTRSKACGTQKQRDHSLEGVWCTKPEGALARRRMVHRTRGTTRSKAYGVTNQRGHSLEGVWCTEPEGPLARRRMMHRTRGGTRSKAYDAQNQPEGACGAQNQRGHSLEGVWCPEPEGPPARRRVAPHKNRGQACVKECGSQEPGPAFGVGTFPRAARTGGAAGGTPPPYSLRGSVEVAGRAGVKQEAFVPAGARAQRRTRIGDDFGVGIFRYLLKVFFSLTGNIGQSLF